MLNPIEAYQEAGRKAAQAMNHNDQSCYAFHSGWASKAIRLESDPTNKQRAREAYEQAYKAARVTPPPTLG